MTTQDYLEELEQSKRINRAEAERRLSRFIEATNENNIKFQIPEYLTCRITLDLMEDPVVTNSGQVYEREAIQESIERNGKTDPFTRKPITGELYPCVPIKKAIADFLEKNPWAYDFSENQQLTDIKF
jgi:STIP1 family protein 1